MQNYKISKLLKNSKFVTKKWIEVKDYQVGNMLPDEYKV